MGPGEGTPLGYDRAVAARFPKNLVVMLAGVGAVASGNPFLVISHAQWEALNWLQDNASPDTVVLTDVEFGTLVPSWGGGARVVYGHPLRHWTLPPCADGVCLFLW